MKEHVFRLEGGMLLRESIEKYCKEHDIQSGIVLTCVGSLRHVHFRLANAKKFYKSTHNYEIVSLVGTISNGEAHIHISVSDEFGKVLGGHLCEGCIVYTTAEIALGELEDYKFKREMDNKSGYDELVVEKK